MRQYNFTVTFKNETDVNLYPVTKKVGNEQVKSKHSK